MSATPSQFEKPRPIFECLPSAIRAAQDAETQLAEMNLSRWAQSFDCSEQDIMSEWERQQWERTQKPSNQFEEWGEK